MLSKLVELRQHGSTTWKVSETPPGKIVYGYGWETYTGKDISPESALSVSAAYACIRGIAETTAMLPKILYRRLPGGGKRRAFEHPLYPIIHDAINPEHTAQTGWELGAGHACAWGNAYYQIVRNKGGQVAELWPLRPDRMEVDRKDGVKVYHYRQADGSPRNFAAKEIMQVPGFGFDGLVGYSPIQMARNALALSMAAEEFGGKFFANDARPGIVLEHPKALSDKAYDRLKLEWNDEYQGSANSHKTKIAEEGMKVNVIGIPPEDAQFLQTRAFQVAEIARYYRYPLTLLDASDKASTYASVEQFLLSFVVHTILPWTVRFDQAINFNLLSPEERGPYFCETLMDSLLRGDIDTRYKSYATGRQWGWLSADDILAMENRNPLPNGQGQTYLTPLNMAPASVKQSFAPVVAEAAERIVRRELHDLRDGIKKIERASATRVADTPNGGMEPPWAAWLENFYAEHARFMERALRPAVESYSGLLNRAGPPAMEEMIKAYTAGNLETARSISDSGILSELLEAWEKELPGLLVEQVFGLFRSSPPAPLPIEERSGEGSNHDE
jgi:HK97 family phage portal protein